MSETEALTVKDESDTVSTPLQINKPALSEAKKAAILKMQQARKEALELQKKAAQPPTIPVEPFPPTQSAASSTEYVTVPKFLMQQKDEYIEKLKQKKNKYKTISFQRLAIPVDYEPPAERNKPIINLQNNKGIENLKRKYEIDSEDEKEERHVSSSRNAATQKYMQNFSMFGPRQSGQQANKRYNIVV